MGQAGAGLGDRAADSPQARVSRVGGFHLWGSCLLPLLSPQDWEVQYQQDTPVAPRFDVNAPDLYIPGLTPPAATRTLLPLGGHG